MGEAIIKRCGASFVTVSHTDGHEFEFEASTTGGVAPSKLFSERWKYRRLPLNADACREAARAAAEQSFREHGLIQGAL